MAMTPESMATPCSVKAKGGADTFLFDAVTNCDRFSRTSSAVSWNMKSGGNLLLFLDSLVQYLSVDLVQFRQIGIQHNFLPTDLVNQVLD